MSTSNAAKYLGEYNCDDEGLEVIKIMYDFSVDGGAVSQILLAKAGQKMVVHKAIMKVNTSVTSGGSATVSLGKTGAVTAFSAAIAKATLVGDYISAGVAAMGAGGVIIAADEYFLLDIAVAALTAGKIECVFWIEKF